MKGWNIAEAKAHFASVLNDAEREPQFICRRNKPVAVVMSIASYQSNHRQRPSLPQMLRKLRKVQEQETVEIEVTPGHRLTF